MKKIFVLVVVVGVAFAGWRLRSHSPAPADGAKLLVFDRLWIDHVPKTEQDKVNVFLALTQQPVGIFQTASMWAGQYEIFRFMREGDQLRVVFPQDGAKDNMRFSAHPCSENGMDFCLELKGGSHGVKRYYSMEGWEVNSLDAERRLLDQIEKK